MSALEPLPCPPVANLGIRRVLLVESQEDQAIYWNALLTSFGYSVMHAPDIGSAERSLGSIPRIIVCGTYLSDGKAVDLFTRVRQRTDLAMAYLILLTSSTGEKDVIESLKSGANDCMDRGGSYGEIRARLELAERMIALNEELRVKSTELAKALGVIQAELSSAAKLQVAMLPRDLEFERLRIRTVYKPCHVLGGDMLAIQVIEDSLVVFCLIDVAGHGTAAALISCGLIREMIDRMVGAVKGGKLDSPQSCGKVVIERMNHHYCELNIPDMYFTAIAGIVNCQNGIFSYCQAGYPSLYSVGREGGVEILEATGLPVGLLSDAEYAVRHLRLVPGQILVICSDGLLRPMPDDPAGVNCVKTLLQECGADLNRIVESLNDCAARENGPDCDDQSAMVIQFN